VAAYKGNLTAQGDDMEDTKPKPFVFVLMPFSDEFTDIYEVGIKPACKDSGAYCERVDEQTFVESILERIYNQIAKADIIIADMTGRNPNVFYETGYAHALNKRVILLTQNADDIPFDLKHYPHLVYGGKIVTLKSQLEPKIKWFVENPQSMSSGGKSDVQLNILDLSDDYSAYGTVHLRVDVYNGTSRTLTPESFGLALITSQSVDVQEPKVRSELSLPNGQYVYNLLISCNLFPGGWDSLTVIYESSNAASSKLTGEITLRTFTEMGPNDYTYVVEETEG
jgi:hypothetical protein